jgi:hypothetical protein
MAFVPEGRCDRSLSRSAWYSATQKSRPVGYGLIRGVRTVSMIGVPDLGNDNTAHILRREIPLGCLGLLRRSYRTLRDGSRRSLSQALRARLRSCCPSGTKYVLRANVLIKLALAGLKPRAESCSPSALGQRLARLFQLRSARPISYHPPQLPSLYLALLFPEKPGRKSFICSPK